MDNIVKKLKVVAKDNHGYTYPVELRLSSGPCGKFEGPGSEELTRYYTHKWCLKIVGTPGTWYISNLLVGAGVAPRISLDSGQGWYVENFAEIMNEARDNI